jgi:hypothetical protein
MYATSTFDLEESGDAIHLRNRLDAGYDHARLGWQLACLTNSLA